MKRDVDFSLLECIDALVAEAVDAKVYVLRNGERVPRGSIAQLKELEADIDTLERHRDSERRGSAKRSEYSRAIARLKEKLASAKRDAEKMKKNLGI